jgi:DNA-binding XRE family transcriptional regulator|tara:strand:+ start:6091 stop:6372 length:282 start_codon:yes stop_codon:yes gene_type:complete
MTNKAPLDFKKIEALRKHMLLTTSNMAELLEISRMTYYGWVKGKPVRRNNEDRVRITLRILLKAMEGGWPQPEIISIEQKNRFKRLLELLDKK